MRCWRHASMSDSVAASHCDVHLAEHSNSDSVHVACHRAPALSNLNSHTYTSWQSLWLELIHRYRWHISRLRNGSQCGDVLLTPAEFLPCDACAVLAVVILSIRLSVTCVLCDKTNQCTADILILHETAITLFFWHQQWLVDDNPFHLKLGLKLTHPLRKTPTSWDFCL